MLLEVKHLTKRFGGFTAISNIDLAVKQGEVRGIIGADWLIYQDLEDLEHAVRHDNAKIKDFDTSCFSGEYVTGDVTPEYLERLQVERSDAAKSLRRERRGKLKVIRGS